MPAMNRGSNFEDLYEEYAAVATVPLTIDWGNKNKGHSTRSIIRDSTQKQLPRPPIITDPDQFPTFLGRKGFGSMTRSPSPLSREYTESPQLVRRSAVRRNTSSRVTSTDSFESIWFAPAGFDVSPPRSGGETSSEEEEDEVSSFGSSNLGAGGSVDTWISTRSRIRIFMYEGKGMSTEIYVGEVYESISYI